MMKKILFLISFLLLPFIVHAQTVTPCVKGGTGTSTIPTFGLVLIGNGTLSNLGCDEWVATSSLGFSSGSTFATTSISALYPLSWNTTTATLSTVATSSLNLTVSSFLSPDISQWTNDSGYITSASGNSKWATSSDNTSIYPNSATKVGFGTSSPFADVDILSTSKDQTPLLNVATSTNGLSTSSALYINAQSESSFGTTSPLARLGVYDLIVSGSPAAFDVVTSLANTYTHNLYVSTAGNVGIGTSSPTTSLTVNASSPVILLTSSSNAPIVRFTLNGVQNGQIAGNSNELQFFGGTQTATAQMILNNSGQVGIATSTPNNLLDIYSATKAALEFDGSATGGGFNWVIGEDKTNGGNFEIASSTALGTTPRFDIDGSGRTGFNTRNPTDVLECNGVTFGNSFGCEFRFDDGATRTNGIVSNFGGDMDLGVNLTMQNVGGDGAVDTLGGPAAYIQMEGNSSGNGAQGSINFNTGSSTAGNIISGTNLAKMTILYTGNVGIFTANPTTARLVITGSSTDSTNLLLLQNLNLSPLYQVENNGNQDVIQGNFGIGTSTPFGYLSIATTTTTTSVGIQKNPFFIIASTTPALGATTTIFSIDQFGHQTSGGQTPSVSGGTSSVVGNDNNGTITITGTALTSLTLTFYSPWTKAPDCTESDNVLSVATDITSISTTQIVFGFGVGGVNSGSLWYQCVQHN